MHTRCLLTALALLLLLAIHADAQSFTLKKKDYPDVGKSVEVTDTETTRSDVTITLNGKAVFNEKKVEVGAKQFIEKVLEAGDKKPKKYTWTFSKAAKGKEGTPVELSYAGKTIIFERQGDGYKVVAEGGGVDQKDLDGFAKNAKGPDQSSALLPKNAVKVGDAWSIDNKAALPLLGGAPEDEIDLAKVKAQGKLVKAYTKGNEQRGVIELTISVPVKKFGPVILDTPIELKLKGTFDAAIDGTSTARSDKATITIKGRSDFTQNNMTLTLDLAIDAEFHREVGTQK